MTTKKTASTLGVLMPVGLCLGSALGVAMDNLPVGVGIGLALGAAIGAGIDLSRRKDDSNLPAE